MLLFADQPTTKLCVFAAGSGVVGFFASIFRMQVKRVYIAHQCNLFPAASIEGLTLVELIVKLLPLQLAQQLQASSIVKVKQTRSSAISPRNNGPIRDASNYDVRPYVPDT